MSNIAIEDNDSSVVLSRALGIASSKILQAAPWQRRHSAGWIVSVDEGSGIERFFVKQITSEIALRQVQLGKRADELFRSDTRYLPLNPVFDTKAGMIVMREVRLPSLSSLWMLRHSRDPVTWHRDIINGMTLAGDWLRRFHAYDVKLGSPVPQLRNYLSRHAPMSEALPVELSTKLLRAAENCPDGPLTVIHSDFSGWNILTDGKQLSVIDYGISDWVEMSPFWDVATFLVSFRAFTRQSRLSPTFWVPGLASRFEAAFLDAYGDPDMFDSQIFAVCAAMRHALCHATIQTDSKSLADWHLDQVRSWLARAT